MAANELLLLNMGPRLPQLFLQKQRKRPRVFQLVSTQVNGSVSFSYHLVVNDYIRSETTGFIGMEAKGKNSCQEINCEVGIGASCFFASVYFSSCCLFFCSASHSLHNVSKAFDGNSFRDSALQILS